MGGLISRYALKYMEQNGMNHNCKLWVSFDSPHHGANIPIGAQLFLDYMANGMGDLSARFGLEKLDTPAAKQMLIHHFRAYTNAPNGVDNEITAGAPGFRDRFYQSLNQMGYPEAGCLRKVALINGTKNGVAQSYSVPCGESMRIRAKLNTTTSAVCYALGIGSCFFTPFCFVPIAACAAGSDRVFEAYTYNSPANSDRCLVMRKQYTSFGIGLAERYVKGRGSNQTSLDALPGGYFNLIQTIVDGAKATVPTRLSKEYPFVIIHSAMSIFTSTDASANQQSPCFIPTVSSLALRNTNRNWGENLSYINTSNAKTETYFDDISVATGANEDHTFLTNAGVTFVRQQLALANQQCGTAPSTCANTGSISYDRWNNIGGGNSVQDLKNNTNNLQAAPSVSQNLSVFQAPSNICDNCGTRIRGYVCPPTSGNYTFWVEGDDNTELWLSTNDQPANIQRIAYHNDWTGSLQWNKYGTQQSAQINLQAGQRYYIEALVKEGGGGDNLAVGWQLPNGTLERPIPSSRIIPFSGTPPPPPPPPGNCPSGSFNGYFDDASCSTFNGWALDQSNFGRKVFVEIRVDGVVVATVEAKESRQDLINAFGTPAAEYHGWWYYPPANASWRNGQNHTVTARICGATSDLANSPKTVNCTGGSGGCTPPAAPNISASPNSISSGGSATLSASGCSGGTVNWSNGASGGSTSVSPTSTTSYTATCTVSGCMSANSNTVTITVTSGGGCASGNFNGHFDTGNCGILNGWALDQNNFGRTVEVEIYVDGTFAKKVSAFDDRQDLIGAFGTAAAAPHGWHYNPLPTDPWRNGTKTVSARICGATSDLNNSPKTVNFTNCRIGVINNESNEKNEGNENNEENGLVLSPNPTEGELRYRLWLPEKTTIGIEISDMLGRTVLRDYQANQSGQLDRSLNMSHLSAGVYLFNLQTDTKRYTKKVVVVR